MSGTAEVKADDVVASPPKLYQPKISRKIRACKSSDKIFPLEWLVRRITRSPIVDVKQIKPTLWPFSWDRFMSISDIKMLSNILGAYRDLLQMHAILSLLLLRHARCSNRNQAKNVKVERSNAASKQVMKHVHDAKSSV